VLPSLYFKSIVALFRKRDCRIQEEKRFIMNTIATRLAIKCRVPVFLS